MTKGADVPEHGQHSAGPDQVTGAPAPGGRASGTGRPHVEAAHRRRRALRGTLSVGLVTALAGAMFIANARLANGVDDRQPLDLAGLQSNEDARVDRLEETLEQLRRRVDELTAAQTQDLDWQSAGTGADVASGTVAVTGTGVVVTLDDAAVDGARPAGVTADDLVVHQQDLQGVINALWAGGAEAMALMDQRVISTSAFQCIGNVLSLQGRRYSPPYRVTAIGDPDALMAALDADPTVRAYRSWVDAVGLGWQVDESTEPLRVPAYDGSVDLAYARVPEGTEILPGLVAAKDTSTSTDPKDG